MSVVQDDASRWKALHEFYKQVHGEITRYRDMEWKVTAWTIALLAGVVLAADKLPDGHVRTKAVLQTLMLVFVVLTIGYGTWHIHFLHKQLTFNRNLRQKVEELFDFHERLVYGPEPILNPRWKGRTIPYSDGLPHLLCWWLAILLVGFYAGVAILLG